MLDFCQGVGVGHVYRDSFRGVDDDRNSTDVVLKLGVVELDAAHVGAAGPVGERELSVGIDAELMDRPIGTADDRIDADELTVLREFDGSEFDVYQDMAGESVDELYRITALNVILEHNGSGARKYPGAGTILRWRINTHIAV